MLPRELGKRHAITPPNGPARQGDGPIEDMVRGLDSATQVIDKHSRCGFAKRWKMVGRRHIDTKLRVAVSLVRQVYFMLT